MDAQQLTDELSLKAMDALGTIIQDHERGLISSAQVATGCKAIFDTVGGMVNDEVFGLISQAALQYKSRGVSLRVTGGPSEDGLIIGRIHFHGAGRTYIFQATPRVVPDYNDSEPDITARKDFNK